MTNLSQQLLSQISVWPAPMEGVMRPAVIRACNRLELVPGWITPFLRVTQSAPKLRDVKAFLAPFEPEQRPVILQLMGTDPALLAEAAKSGIAAGAVGIDLNCGCPSRQVIAHGAGAGALREWERTPRIAAAIRAAIPENWFSIKLRIGFDCPAEAASWLPRLEQLAAPDAFLLHYRTVREGYAAAPGRRERLAAARTAVKRAALLGNGDLASVAETRTLCGEANLDGALIGRGFWRDPWIFRRLTGDESQTPEAARQMLWHELAQTPYEKEWTLGAAIELASLILGANSPEATALKAAHQRVSASRFGKS